MCCSDIITSNPDLEFVALVKACKSAFCLYTFYPKCNCLLKSSNVPLRDLQGEAQSQCWGSYFLKVIYYILLVTSAKSNELQLLITLTKVTSNILSYILLF